MGIALVILLAVIFIIFCISMERQNEILIFQRFLNQIGVSETQRKQIITDAKRFGLKSIDRWTDTNYSNLPVAHRNSIKFYLNIGK